MNLFQNEYHKTKIYLILKNNFYAWNRNLYSAISLSNNSISSLTSSNKPLSTALPKTPTRCAKVAFASWPQFCPTKLPSSTRSQSSKSTPSIFSSLLVSPCLTYTTRQPHHTQNSITSQTVVSTTPTFSNSSYKPIRFKSYWPNSPITPTHHRLCL